MDPIQDTAPEAAPQTAPDENEEFEFRARAEHEAKLAAAPSAPEPAPADSGLTIPQALVGAGQTAFNIAAEHPLTTLGGLGVAAKYGAIKDMFGQGINAMNSATAQRYAQTLTQMEHQARQYIKAGQAVPQGLQDALNGLRSRVTGAMPTAPMPTAPAPAMPPAAMPAAPAMPPPPTSPAAPPTAQNFIQRMAQQFGQMSQQAAPYVQKAAPIVRAGGVALAGMAPATLNSNEQEELARRDPNYARFLANRPRYPGQQ